MGFHTTTFAWKVWLTCCKTSSMFPLCVRSKNELNFIWTPMTFSKRKHTNIYQHHTSVIMRLYNRGYSRMQGYLTVKHTLSSWLINPNLAYSRSGSKFSQTRICSRLTHKTFWTKRRIDESQWKRTLRKSAPFYSFLLILFNGCLHT